MNNFLSLVFIFLLRATSALLGLVSALRWDITMSPAELIEEFMELGRALKALKVILGGNRDKEQTKFPGISQTFDKVLSFLPARDDKVVTANR